MICISPKLFAFISLLKVSANKESAYKKIPGIVNNFLAELNNTWLLSEEWGVSSGQGRI